MGLHSINPNTHLHTVLEIITRCKAKGSHSLGAKRYQLWKCLTTWMQPKNKVGQKQLVGTIFGGNYNA